jgi:hypothetical protein
LILHQSESNNLTRFKSNSNLIYKRFILTFSIWQVQKHLLSNFCSTCSYKLLVTLTFQTLSFVGLLHLHYPIAFALVTVIKQVLIKFSI